MRFVEAAGVSTHVESWGPASGEPLLLIPGLMCTADLYRDQIAALKSGRDVVVADHSRSDSMAGIAGGILSVAPPLFALAGLSMGGYVAFEILRQAPLRVTRLALLDTSARADLADQSERRRELVEIARRRSARFVQKTLLPKLISPGSMTDITLVERIMAMADDTGVEAFARQQAAIISRLDSRPLLGGIRCPTLVVVGAEDELTPLNVAEEIRAGIPGSRLVVVPGAGHLSPIEQPAAVTAALKIWLDD